MGLLFNRPKAAQGAQPTRLLNLQVQTSGYGQVIPIVYGQNRISGKLIWYGDFTPIPHTSKQATGGKGLGSSGSSNSTTSYTYTTAVAILLCEGGIAQLCNVWDTKGKLALVSTSENYTVAGGGGSYQVTQHANYFHHYGVSRADAYSVGTNDFGSDGAATLAGTQKTPMSLVPSGPATGQYTLNPATGTFTFAAGDAGKQVTITYVYSIPDSNSNGQPLQDLALTLFTGTRPQTPWTYLTSIHPGQDLGYSGFAYVACSAMDLGSSGSLPNYSYEILGLLPFGAGITDCNPGDVIADLVSNPFYGGARDANLILDPAFLSAGPAGTTYWDLQAGFSKGFGAVNFIGNGSPTSIVVAKTPIINVTPGVTYTLICYIDATAVTSGLPFFAIYRPDVGLYYSSVGPLTPGTAGLFTVQWTCPIGVTQVRCLCDTTGCTISNGGVLSWSRPSLTPGLTSFPPMIGDYSNFSAYCLANGLFLSPVLDSQQTAASIIDDLADLANGAAVWSEGVLKLRSYGDTTAVGNGTVFIPNTTPVYDLTDADFKPQGKSADPVVLSRKSRADTYNDIKIEFVNRANSYNIEIAEDKDDADISEYGLKAADPRQAHSITDATVAKKMVHLQRLRSVYIDGGNTYKFTVGWQYVLLEPMDLVTLTDANLGLTKHPVRITSIKESADGWLEIEAEEFPWGTATPTAYPYVSGIGFQPSSSADPGSVNAPILFEANDRLSTTWDYEIWMGLSGGANWGGCNVWVSTDNATFRKIGTINGSARTGSLTASLASHADPDTADTLAVDLTESSGVLSSGSAADCDNFRTLCWVDGELISYQDATLTSAFHYSLATRLRRGVFGSPIGSHSSGARFLRLDDAVFIWRADATLVSQTLYFKFTSFNQFELMEQDLANVTSYSYSFGGKFNNFSQIVSNDGTVDFDPASVTGTNCTVRVYGRVTGTPTPGHQVTFTRSDKTTFTEAAASFTGQALLTTFFAMFNPWDGSIYLLNSYTAMTSATYNGHINIGSVTTPNSGGTGGTTGGGGGGFGGGAGDCPCCWMEDFSIPMADVAPGDKLWCLDVPRGYRYQQPVEHSKRARASCVMLFTENGAIWAGSRTTPFDLPDGKSVTAEEMEGQPIATDRGPGTPLAWSHVTHVRNIGTHDVQHISLGGRTFACGLPGKPRVYSHNYNKY